MNNIFAKLSPAQKGALLIGGGFLLLLYTLGIIQTGLNTLLIIGAIIMIVYGILIGDYYTKIRKMFQKKNLD
jgi:hypothetical protein